MASCGWQFERFRLNNLFDKTYSFTANPSQAMPGAPITVQPAVRVEF